MKSFDVGLSQANQAFFEAFRAGDASAMARLWARGFPLVCVHPGMTPIHGREPVLRSWRGILRHPKAPQLQCLKSEDTVLGSSGVVTSLAGTVSGDARLVVTNVFVFEEGHWRIVSHHAAPLSSRGKGTARKPSEDQNEPGLLN